MPNLSKDETKEAMKEAIKEWIDDRYREFGKWSFRALCTFVFAWGIYFILTHGGLDQIKPH